MASHDPAAGTRGAAPRRATALALLLGVGGCGPRGAIDGQLLDGPSGTPREGVVLEAEAVRDAPENCRRREVTTGVHGDFRFDGICPGVRYRLTAPGGVLQLDGAVAVLGEAAPQSVASVRAWRSSGGRDGVFRLSGDRLVPILPFADVATDIVVGTEMVVRYPSLRPVQVPLVAADEWLVIAGAGIVGHLKLHPLIADPAERAFEGDVRIDGHAYIGVRFHSDTEAERVDASVDAERVHRVGTGTSVLEYVAWDAAPAGRYALLGDTDSQTYVVDLGSAPSAEER